MACKHIGDNEYCKNHQCCTVGFALAMSDEHDPDIDKHLNLCFAISEKISRTNEKLNNIRYYVDKTNRYVREATFEDVNNDMLEKVLEQYENINNELDSVIKLVQIAEQEVTYSKETEY